MRFSKCFAFCAALSVLSLPLLSQSVLAQEASIDAPLISDKQKANATLLMEKALKSDLGFGIVESLTTEIGPRLAGSEAEKRAREWGFTLGKKLKFDKVRVEEFTMPFWDRGHLHIALTEPYDQALYGITLGGAAPSKKPINAPIVYFRDIHALAEVKEGALKGKVAFVDGEMLVKSQTGAGYSTANQRRRIGWQHAQRGQADALIVRSVGSSSHRFPHTGMMSSNKDNEGNENEWAKIPVVAISNPDADHLRRLHKLGKPLNIALHSESKWKGEVSSGNVVMDIIGSEKPDEIVLIGGHLDSWDLGTGAVDDGAGVGITMAAMALIVSMVARAMIF